MPISGHLREGVCGGGGEMVGLGEGWSGEPWMEVGRGGVVALTPDLRNAFH